MEVHLLARRRGLTLPLPPRLAVKKKSSSSKLRSDDIKDLDEKWSERYARLEAMLVSKTFTVPVNPV